MAGRSPLNEQVAVALAVSVLVFPPLQVTELPLLFLTKNLTVPVTLLPAGVPFTVAVRLAVEPEAAIDTFTVELPTWICSEVLVDDPLKLASPG